MKKNYFNVPLTNGFKGTRGEMMNILETPNEVMTLEVLNSTAPFRVLIPKSSNNSRSGNFMEFTVNDLNDLRKLLSIGENEED